MEDEPQQQQSRRVPRKRRRIDDDESDYDAETDATTRSAVGPSAAAAADSDAADEDEEEEEEEEEEVVEVSSGWVPPAPPASAASAAAAPFAAASRSGAAGAAARAAVASDDDDVLIVDAPPRTATTAAQKRKHAARTPSPAQLPSHAAAVAATAASSSGSAAPAAQRKRLRLVSQRPVSPPHSPTAPPLEPISPPQSPEAPPASPIGVRGRSLADSSADVREELAVRRAMQARRKPPIAVARADAVSVAAAATPQPAPAAAAAAAAASPVGGSQIRRRKAPASTAASSSLASAALLHSYASSVGLAAPSHLPPELQWHEDNSVPMPSNAADRIDVERTFLQQVLIWEPFAAAAAANSGGAGSGGGGGGGMAAKSGPSKPSSALLPSPAVPREMQAFARFLDASVPLPVHFTTPQAYLGYFGPIVLDNFRAQIGQTVALNVGEVPMYRAGASAAAGAPASHAPVLSPQAERHRSCWSAVGMQACSSVSGGGDDWFEARLRLALSHRSINELSGADVVVLGIDEPQAPRPHAHNSNAGGMGGPREHPSPSASTTYVFAFLDGLSADQASCFARVRLYLPGVGSSMSSYVSPSSSGLARSRFQLFYNRLAQACAAASAPESAGGPNPNANFAPLGAPVRGRADSPPPPVHHIYLTRVETIITTIREYNALVKVSCLLGLRLQSELLRPSPDAPDSDDEDSAALLLAGSGSASTPGRAIDVTSPAASDVDDDGGDEEEEEAPPALESLDEVVEAVARKKRREARVAQRAAAAAKKSATALTGVGAAKRVSLSHLDSAAWMGLPSGFREFVRATLNEHQLKAVQVALKRYEKPGFTLLQGPPGTGKSKTVVALLNALHLGAFQRHYDSVIAHFVQGHATAPSKPRILVCAPSNTAVDELIMRVLETGLQYRPPTGATAPPAKNGAPPPPPPTLLTPDQAVLNSLKGTGGFVDGQRCRYTPDIVRVGNSDAIRPELKSIISLDALVENYHKLPESELQSRLAGARAYVAAQERALGELRVVHTKSACVLADMKATLDSLSALGHDVRKQSQHAVYERLHAEHLAHQRSIAHVHEKRTLAAQDAQRCDLALQFKMAGRPGSVGGGGAGNARKEREAALDALRISFLNQAQIVFCTLSGAGLDLLSRLDQPFRALIVDEAAQCTEVAALIPLTHDVQHCVLVGDPRQLPATVFSQDVAAKRMWERSLFERLEQAGHQMHSLTVQYRMHSDIRQFPSDYFYKGMLADADFITRGDLYKQPYHAHALFRPLLFLDLQSAAVRGGVVDASGDESATRSLGNAKEAVLVVNMIASLLTQFPLVNAKQIGIITFYQKQKSVLQDQLKRKAATIGPPHNAQPSALLLAKPQQPRKPGQAAATAAAAATSSAASSGPTLSQSLLQVEVATVDGFQGREKEIIIVSCVRGGATGGLGFVDDVRRMNVALTRAKFACWVVGDSRALRRSPHWGAFLESVAVRGRYHVVQQGEFEDQAQQQQQQQQHQQGQEQWRQQQSHHNNGAIGSAQGPQGRQPYQQNQRQSYQSQQQRRQQQQQQKQAPQQQQSQQPRQALLPYPSSSAQPRLSPQPLLHQRPSPSPAAPLLPTAPAPPPPGFALLDLGAVTSTAPLQPYPPPPPLPLPLMAQQPQQLQQPQPPPGFALLELPVHMQQPAPIYSSDHFPPPPVLQQAPAAPQPLHPLQQAQAIKRQQDEDLRRLRQAAP